MARSVLLLYGHIPIFCKVPLKESFQIGVNAHILLC